MTIIKHFSTLFSDDFWLRPVLADNEFYKLIVDQNNSLCLPFAMEEIEAVVWSCEDDKSPGPDDFKFKFIKTFWPTIRCEVYGMISEFYSGAKLLAGLVSSFISLISKRDNPHVISDYRPITLIGRLYKIISKLLARRLKVALENVILHGQTTFLPKRHILDGVVIWNEIVDFEKKKKKECLIFKVDFEMAYDSVN